MQQIYLIFRRDYLSYVSAWGFWLGLLAAPLIMVLIGAIFGYAASSTPDRYYAVIEQGDTLSRAIKARFERDDEEFTEAMTQVSETLPVDQAQMKEATEQASSFGGRFIEIPAPATSIDELRPYLLGDKKVTGPIGELDLFAVVIAQPGTNSIEYWSNDVNNDSLKRRVRDASEDITRKAALELRGLPADFISSIDDGAAKVESKRIRTQEEQEKLGNDVTASDRAPTWVSVGLAYFLWLMIFSVIQYLLMGTIEERGNKIFDTLLTSVRLPHLLAGKLLAVFGVTATIMAAWGLTAIGGSLFAASMVPELGEKLAPFASAILSPQMMIPALICFVVGYLMYGVMFMALGSLCDTIQEAQSLLSPLMIILMLPMLAIVITVQDPGSPLVDMAAWVPIFTPFVLILRMPHDPPMWEVIAQIVLMLVTTAVVLWLATKVYRAGAVHGAGAGDAMKYLRRMVGMKA